MVNVRMVGGAARGRCCAGMTLGSAAAALLATSCGSDATVLGGVASASSGAGDGIVFTPFETYRDQARIELNGQLIYRVEWDLLFETEEQLLDHYLSQVELISTRSARAAQDKAVAMMDESFNLLHYERGPEALQITYCIRQSHFSSLAQVEADMEEATHAWERAANVRFAYEPWRNGDCVDAASAGVDFVVLDTSSSSANGCSALIPEELGCTPGTLNVDYTVWPWPWFDGAGNPSPITNVYPNLTLVGILRHELGHILGLRHEHPFNPSGLAPGCNEPQIVQCPEPNCDLLLRGEPLTEYDVDSVMHYPFCEGNANTAFELTPLDGRGIRFLYGMPVAWHRPLMML